VGQPRQHGTKTHAAAAAGGSVHGWATDTAVFMWTNISCLLLSYGLMLIVGQPLQHGAQAHVAAAAGKLSLLARCATGTCCSSSIQNRVMSDVLCRFIKTQLYLTSPTTHPQVLSVLLLTAS
jgi:hypothetical protein